MKKDFIVRRSITMVEGKPHVETYSEQELIRCKDCKNKEKDGISEGFHYCNINGLQVTDDWFCADGVKKDG